MADWIKVGDFSTRFEAEIARARLESADIPAKIVSHEGGIFGPGFQGAVPSGVELHAPSNRLSEAQEALGTSSDSTG